MDTARRSDSRHGSGQGEKLWIRLAARTPAMAPARVKSYLPYMSTVNEIAERHVARFAEIDPVTASTIGLVGYDDRMTDLSPDGFASRDDLDHETIAALHR